jgi:hypothetical protein
VAQGVGPEFKPQYHKKKKCPPRWTSICWRQIKNNTGTYIDSWGRVFQAVGTGSAEEMSLKLNLGSQRPVKQCHYLEHKQLLNLLYFSDHMNDDF